MSYPKISYTLCYHHSTNEHNKNVFLFLKLQREHQISPGDFPDIKRMKEQLVHQDFTKFKQLDMRLLQKVRNAICTLSKQDQLLILQTTYKRTNEFVNLNRLTKCWLKTFQNLCS